MFRSHLNMLNDPFFSKPSDIDAGFTNLESFINRPFRNMKRPAIDGPSSVNRDVAFRDDSVGNFFDDFHSNFKDMHDMFNKTIASFDTNYNPKDPNSTFYSSSSVYSYQNDLNSKEPQIYQAHKSIRQGPGGLREEQKAERDSRRAEEKMAIGHYIGGRGREVERKRNTRTGDQEENVNLHGLENAECDHFVDEWDRLANKCFNFGPGMERSHQITNDHHSKPIKDKSSKSKKHLAITDGKFQSRNRH